MAENVVLTNLANLQNDTTTISVINGNNAIITAAFADVLSRSGVSPNQMAANFDMNNNNILNLPAPTTSTSPVRLVDMVGQEAITIATSQVVGNVTGVPVSTGIVGEYITANASAVSLTTATAKTITSITIGAGDWDVWGTVYFLPNTTTSVTKLNASMSNTTNTSNATIGTFASTQMPATVPGSGANISMDAGPIQFISASSQTIFLVANATFTVSTMTANGIIMARRRD